MAEPLGRVFAANILRELRARGWTKSELAKRCGWEPPRISELLAQRYSPSLQKVERVAEAFGITAASLLIPPPEEFLDKIPA